MCAPPCQRWCCSQTVGIGLPKSCRLDVDLRGRVRREEQAVGDAAQPVVDEEHAHERQPLEDEARHAPAQICRRERRHAAGEPDEDEVVGGRDAERGCHRHRGQAPRDRDPHTPLHASKPLIRVRRMPPVATLEVHSPFDGEVVGDDAEGRRRRGTRAVDAAAEALDAPLPAHERARILDRVAALLGERSDEAARLICAEAGKPMKAARVEAQRAASTYTFAAVEARKLAGEMVPMDASKAGAGKLAFTLRCRSGSSARSRRSTSRSTSSRTRSRPRSPPAARSC